MASTSTVLETLADYVRRERAAPFPPDVLHHAKRSVIDWFAALLPGTLLPPATLLRAALPYEVGRGSALLHPSGERATVRAAALVNGTASHAAEFDDIFRDAIYHPGSPVVAAALAAAEARGATGQELLRAIVVGYEVSTRIAVAVSPAHYTYWHTTGTVGTFGAAAACAAVLRLDGGATAHALATAATFAAGLQQAFRSDAMSKPLHAGRAAEGGLLAALAAECGVTGALDVLEGERGFGAATSENVDWSRAVEDLGRRYNITRVTIKNHGCCGHTFPAIDAMLALRREHGLTPEAVRRVEVATYRTALEVTGTDRVTTPFEARFSLPYVVSTALVHGSVRLDAFTPERLADARTRDLMRRIEVRVDPELDRLFPGRRAATICVWTANGERLEHHQPTRRGDPDAPLTDAELVEKFHELTAPVIGTHGALRLLDVLWSLDEAGTVMPLAEAPTAAGRVS